MGSEHGDRVNWGTSPVCTPGSGWVVGASLPRSLQVPHVLCVIVSAPFSTASDTPKFPSHAPEIGPLVPGDSQISSVTTADTTTRVPAVESQCARGPPTRLSVALRGRCRALRVCVCACHPPRHLRLCGAPGAAFGVPHAPARISPAQGLRPSVSVTVALPHRVCPIGRLSDAWQGRAGHCRDLGHVSSKLRLAGALYSTQLPSQ